MIHEDRLKFVKICELQSCGRTFKTNRKWQKFCRDRFPDDPEYCYKEYWRIEKSKRFASSKKVRDLENRIKQLEKQNEARNAT